MFKAHSYIDFGIAEQEESKRFDLDLLGKPNSPSTHKTRKATVIVTVALSMCLL